MADRKTKFESQPITGSSIVITKAGDGLSDALKVDPVELHHGETVYFVLRGKVRSIGFPPETVRQGIPSKNLVRQHTIDTTDIAIVEEAAVAQMLADAADRVQRGLDSIAGQGRLDDPEPHAFDPEADADNQCTVCGAKIEMPWHIAGTS